MKTEQIRAKIEEIRERKIMYKIEPVAKLMWITGIAMVISGVFLAIIDIRAAYITGIGLILGVIVLLLCPFLPYIPEENYL